MYACQRTSLVDDVFNDGNIPLYVMLWMVGDQDDILEQFLEEGHNMLYDTPVANQKVRFFGPIKAFALTPRQYDSRKILIHSFHSRRHMG